MVTKQDANASVSSTEEIQDEGVADSSTANDDVKTEDSEDSSNSDNASAEGQDDNAVTIDRFDKHPRFQELIRKNKESEQRIAALEADLKSKIADKDVKQEDKQDFIEEYVSEYVSLGYPRDFAKRMANNQWKMAVRASQTTVAPLQQETVERKSRENYLEWKSSQKDVTPELEKKMVEWFKSQDENTRNWLANEKMGSKSLDFIKFQVMSTMNSQKPVVNKQAGQALGKKKGEDTDVKSITQEMLAEYIRKNPNMSDDEYDALRLKAGLN